MNTRWLALLVGLGAMISAAQAQNTPQIASASTNTSKYPKTNLATWYEVDPAWPQHPKGFANAAVSSVTVDKQDNVWVFTRTKPAVQVFSPEGRYLKGWWDNPKTVAHTIKFDKEGNVWLVDVGTHTVRKHKPDGELLLTLGTDGIPGDDEKHFNKPTDLTFGPQGDIFVSDGYGNSRVVRFDKNGKFIKAWGTLGTAAENFSLPHGIACDSKGRLYVADRNNVRIQVYNADGKLLDSWANIIVPWSFWVTEKDEIWVCGSSPMPWKFDAKYPTLPLGCPPKDQVFMKFNTEGKLLQLWTVPKGEDGQEKPGDLNWVHTMALDSKGNIYAGDIIGKRVQKFVRQN